VSRLTLPTLLAHIAAGRNTVGQVAALATMPTIAVDAMARRLESAGLIVQAGPRHAPVWSLTRRGTSALARLNGGSK